MTRLLAEPIENRTSSCRSSLTTKYSAPSIQKNQDKSVQSTYFTSHLSTAKREQNYPASRDRISRAHMHHSSAHEHANRQIELARPPPRSDSLPSTTITQSTGFPRNRRHGNHANNYYRQLEITPRAYYRRHENTHQVHATDGMKKHGQEHTTDSMKIVTKTSYRRHENNAKNILLPTA